MTETVKRYNLRQNIPATATTFLPDVVVSASDYARLEQECERLRSLWELELDRATTAENESAINQWALDEARRVLGKCQEMLDPHRDAVLWGEVCDAFKVKP